MPEPAADQSEPETPRRFITRDTLAALPEPDPTLPREQDPAFRWVRIPRTFRNYNDVNMLRANYGWRGFQFDWDNPRYAPGSANEQYVRVRRDPHQYDPTTGAKTTPDEDPRPHVKGRRRAKGQTETQREAGQ